MPRRVVVEVPDKHLLPKAVRRLSLTNFLCLLFRHNHKLAQAGEEELLTDEQIRELARRKYPKSATVASFYTPQGDTINSYRQRFNKGAFDHNIDYRCYPFVSFRYDEYGNVVEPRRGIFELNHYEQEQLRLKFFTIRHKKGIYVPSEVVKELVSLSLVPAPQAHE